MKTKIPVGTFCFQDFQFFHWPRQTDDPDQWFIATKTKTGSFELTAPNYGQKNEYGNGSILVRQFGPP
jgi:hypothetical protein